MAIYLNVTNRAPSLPGVPIDYPYLNVWAKAYTTPDFQPATQVVFTITAASFSTDVPLTGVVSDGWGDVPSGTYATLGIIKQNINVPLEYNTEYHFQGTITGYNPSEGAGEVTSDVFTFTTESENGNGAPSDPINPTPEHGKEGIGLSDTNLSWEDGGGAETYDVYFRPYGEFFDKVASDIVGLSVNTAEFLHANRYLYGDLYFWCVIAKNEYGRNYTPPSGFGIGYDGTIWEFNAMVLDPPLPSGVTLDYSGDSSDEGFGEPTGTPTGLNNMIAVRRLVAAARNKIWYEDL